MNTMKCPNCSTEMKEVKEPDITTDVCPNCGGVYLTQGELNVLATGMAGDIEFCSIDEDVHKEHFPIRKCPKCQDQNMEKINLLCYSDIIFDFCPKCNGFFLDKGELNDINVELEKLTKHKTAEEYRGYIGNHLVRSDRVDDVMICSRPGTLTTYSTNVSYIRISVYYTKPLGMGLWMHSENWTHKFMKTLGLSNKQEIQTGHTEVDNTFIIQGDNVDNIKDLLSSSDIQNELINFIKEKPKIFEKPGTLQILDTHIIYSEGPYTKDTTYNVEDDPSGIVNRMVKIATLFGSP